MLLIKFVPSQRKNEIIKNDSATCHPTKPTSIASTTSVGAILCEACVLELQLLSFDSFGNTPLQLHSQACPLSPMEVLNYEENGCN